MLKTNFTKSVNSASRITKFLKDKPPSSSAISTLETAMAKLNRSYDKLEEQLNLLRTIDSENYDEYDLAFDESTTRYNEALKDILGTIAILQAPPAQPIIAPPPVSINKIRPNEALKPFLLTRDHTPVEMRSWVNKFKAFYSTSLLDKCTIQEQQAYFKICIDPSLEARISDQIQENTPIFGDDGCLSLIEEEFRQKYPLCKEIRIFSLHTKFRSIIHRLGCYIMC